MTAGAVRRFAEEVLLPAAAAVDAADRVPEELLDAMAAAGLYAVGAPPAFGGPDLSEPERHGVTETLAGACLAAAFVWLQHRGALRAVCSFDAPALHALEVPGMIVGRRRGGLAIGAATRPGPAVLRAERAAGGWAVSGTAPWVTGWGMVDVLLVAARDADDVIVWSLVDLTAPASRAALAAEPLRLTAARASGTVTLHVDRLPVPDDRVLGLQPHADYLARDAESLAGNGFLAVGVAARAIAGLDAGVAAALGGELDDVRQALLDGTATTLPGARAAAAELAVRAAAALAVHDGAAAVLAGSRAERLQREAAFCLGFGSRPAIRSRLLQVLSGGAARSGTPTDRA